MKRLGFSWYVFGAHAVAVYGQPRMTADVDITVAAGDVPAQEVVQALLDHGFSLRIDLDEAFLQKTCLLPLSHQETGMPVDMILASTALHEDSQQLHQNRTFCASISASRLEQHPSRGHATCKSPSRFFVSKPKNQKTKKRTHTNIENLYAFFR